MSPSRPGRWLGRRGDASSVLPSDFLARVGRERGERVLAAAEVDAGWLVATDRALVQVGEAQVWRRGWEAVDHAAWDDESRRLVVHWVDSPRPTLLRLADRQTYLPEVVRERVQASVVLSVRVPPQASRGVRVCVRRDASGALLTQVLPDAGVRLDADPVLAARVADLVREARGQVGLPPE